MDVLVLVAAATAAMAATAAANSKTRSHFIADRSGSVETLH